MSITIINDCRDANAAGRQMARTSALFGEAPTFVGVSSDLEASGNLIDILDAHGQSGGTVLVNVAPRHGAAKKWENGTPFGYFWYSKTLVAASVDGLTLSLAKKFALADAVNVLDIPAVAPQIAEHLGISAGERDHIARSQFRSFDFLPRVAKYVYENSSIEGTPWQMNEIPDAPPAVWWIDNFGNAKTTLTPDDIPQSFGEEVETVFGTLPYYERLADVPDASDLPAGDAAQAGGALIKGSSGLGDTRFLEIVLQGESAAERFGIASGSPVLAE